MRATTLTKNLVTRRIGAKMNINDMMEELIQLDEIAGEMDEETNRRIDARRAELKSAIERFGEKEVDSNIVLGYN